MERLKLSELTKDNVLVMINKNLKDLSKDNLEDKFSDVLIFLSFGLNNKEVLPFVTLELIDRIIVMLNKYVVSKV